MDRMVICPSCNKGTFVETGYCIFCKAKLELLEDDCRFLYLEDYTDGYHSWYSQPTAYHAIYRCINFPHACSICTHRKERCHLNGKIDIREPVKKE